MGKKKKEKKYLLMGLDNAGKTSVYLSLNRETNLLSYVSVHPTRGLAIENIKGEKSTYSIWDFGGQEEMRKDYLQSMTEHLKSTDKIFYIIDIQDIQRYDETLDYLRKIVENIRKLKMDIRISIFFHKFDQGIENKDDFSFETLNERLISKIKDIIRSSLSFDIFKTAIHAIFQKSKIF